MNPKAIVTIPPYAPFIDDVLQHPAVSGIRLNTVMPVKKADTLDDVIARLQMKAERYRKDLYVDLKCRQLRVKSFGVPPFTEIELTHAIEVHTPVKAYFSAGEEVATVLEVDGNRLIMQEGPKRVVGPGESVNILHSSLRILGYLTETDQAYIAACRKNKLHNYMLSFVEGKQDREALLKLDPEANIVEKIESTKGLRYVREEYDRKARLMLARGDLFIEVEKPHEILQASEDVLKKDHDAIAASRIFPSLAFSLNPSCADINDLDNLLRTGYKTVMLGDEVCQHADSVMSSLNLFYEIAKRYGK
ncbi:MAG: pyruvate kinase [Nanoarchaeota archaeon]